MSVRVGVGVKLDSPSPRTVDVQVPATDATGNGESILPDRRFAGGVGRVGYSVKDDSISLSSRFGSLRKVATLRE